MSAFQRPVQPSLLSSTHQYWLFQIAGWSAMTLLSYLSLTIWYNPGEWMHALHTVVQSALGLIVSHPLRWVAKAVWDSPAVRRVSAIIIAIIVASVLWTFLRLLTFQWLTGEVVKAEDYGGWLFASVIVYGSWVFCYHALKYYRQSIEQKEVAAEAQRAVLEAKNRAQEESMKRLAAENHYREARLRMLMYQINPHFLFNSLNAVSSLVRKGEADNATEMLSRIGDFLRLTLDHDDELEHSLSEELDVLNLYLSIEKTRFGNRLQTEFEMSDEAKECIVPSFLLQPLFENAVKYAVGRSLDPTTISLRAWIEEGRLELRITDNGPGPTLAEDEQRSTGIGLQNVEQRLRSSYPDQYRFQLKPNSPRGLAVDITIEHPRTESVLSTLGKDISGITEPV